MALTLSTLSSTAVAAGLGDSTLGIPTGSGRLGWRGPRKVGTHYGQEIKQIKFRKERKKELDR
jgi:hypothetical protein